MAGCLLLGRQYGIEYGYVGGDPAELMRICVENGMFTVSFLKEVLHKVRRDVGYQLCSHHGKILPVPGLA